MALFQRIWSEEDDITILNGIISYKNEYGKFPKDDMETVYDSVKEDIIYEGKNIQQFVIKINTLKKKYLTKKMNDEAAPTFVKPHDKECFDLSELIWGCEVETKRKKRKIKLEREGGKVETEKDWFLNSFVATSIASFGTDEATLKEKWSAMSSETKKTVQRKWRKLEGKALKVSAQKTHFVHHVATLLDLCLSG